MTKSLNNKTLNTANDNEVKMLFPTFYVEVRCLQNHANFGLTAPSTLSFISYAFGSCNNRILSESTCFALPASLPQTWASYTKALLNTKRSSMKSPWKLKLTRRILRSIGHELDHHEGDRLHRAPQVNSFCLFFYNFTFLSFEKNFIF